MADRKPLPPHVIRALVLGVVAGSLLLLPKLLVAGLHLPGDLLIVAYCYGFGIAGAATATMIAASQGGRMRRARRRLRALVAMHKEGLLGEDEFDERRQQAISEL